MMITWVQVVMVEMKITDGLKVYQGPEPANWLMSWLRRV